MRIVLLLWLIAAAFVAGCSESGPYLRVGGGGFVFNYRIGEATAGVVVEPERTLPERGTIEATFQNPSGGAPFVMTKTVSPNRKRYSFTTPPLSGVRAHTDYLMTVRLFDAGGDEIDKAETVLRSDLDQTVLPDQPLTVGPGYAPNPAPGASNESGER